MNRREQKHDNRTPRRGLRPPQDQTRGANGPRGPEAKGAPPMAGPRSLFTKSAISTEIPRSRLHEKMNSGMLCPSVSPEGLTPAGPSHTFYIRHPPRHFLRPGPWRGEPPPVPPPPLSSVAAEKMERSSVCLCVSVSVFVSVSVSV